MKTHALWWEFSFSVSLSVVEEERLVVVVWTSEAEALAVAEWLSEAEVVVEDLLLSSRSWVMLEITGSFVVWMLFVVDDVVVLVVVVVVFVEDDVLGAEEEMGSVTWIALGLLTAAGEAVSFETNRRRPTR